MRLLFSDNLEVPLPDLSRNGLTDGAENTQVLHLVLDVLVASALQQTQSGGRNIELRDVVLLDDVPVAGEVGVGGRALEDDRSHTE